MYNDLNVGMTLYHKTNKTKARIMMISNANLTIELSEEISHKKTLTLPITHIGEWLFFSADDVDLSVEVLATMPMYVKYNNKKIIEAYNKSIEEKKKIETEQNRKQLELAKLQEIELHKQHKSEDEIKLNMQLKVNFIGMLKSKYQFEGFHHYTDFKNFLNIMKTGKLYSRNEIKKREFIDAAEQSIIDNTSETVKDCVRFYYKEKTPTLYNIEGIKEDNSSPHMPLPVLLLFNENIINNENIEFTDGCGGSKNTTKTKNIQEAINFDWETIFSRKPIPTYYEDIMVPRYHNKKNEIINKRNAEFLVNREIGTEYIKKIIFRAPADKKVAELILGKNKLFFIDNERKKFNYKKKNNYKYNFLYDYKIKQIGNDFLVDFKFFNQDIQDIKNYSHELCIYYNDNTYETFYSKDLNTKRIDLIKSKEDEYFNFDFMLKIQKHISVCMVEYMMNGHLCALWENKTYD